MIVAALMSSLFAIAAYNESRLVWAKANLDKIKHRNVKNNLLFINEIG